MAGLVMENVGGRSLPILIAIQGRGDRPACDHRQVPDAVFWIARAGSPWRDLFEELGKWSSVYRLFRRWTLLGM
ncbi:transposase [Oricola cellulosilytica]|uniref:Transposase n=1 Tax=Oricola cellulosilytica TaxID=1429082 RepID=A0A4R0PAU1_9HYPH|nr:transposase [Oricola cellulosilytica]